MQSQHTKHERSQASDKMYVMLREEEAESGNLIVGSCLTYCRSLFIYLILEGHIFLRKMFMCKS